MYAFSFLKSLLLILHQNRGEPTPFILYLLLVSGRDWRQLKSILSKYLDRILGYNINENIKIEKLFVKILCSIV